MSSSKFVPLRVVLVLQILLLAAVCNGERFCGTKLTDTLKLLCSSRYASLMSNRNIKRSGGGKHFKLTLNSHLKNIYSFWFSIFAEKQNVDDGDDNGYINESITYPQFAYQSYPFASRFGLTSALSPRFRRDLTEIAKRGIIDECCIRSCSIPVLMTYCGA